MLLIGNGKLFTRDRENPSVEDGCVAIQDRRILKIGKTAELRENYQNADFIDARGGLIMPGFINVHHHAYSAFARGLSIPGNNPANFTQILEGTWWKLDRALSHEAVKYSGLVTFIECIRRGVTTVFDHHASYGSTEGSLFSLDEAATSLGLRACLCYEVSDRDGEDRMKEAVAENLSYIEALKKRGPGLTAAMMGLHASFTLSDETLSYIQERLPQGTGFHIHVAEDFSDVRLTLARHGKRVVHRLYDSGVLGPKTLAAHCIHLSPGEMALLKETDTMAVYNPQSNMGNAVGCPPVLKLLEQGVLMGLGTDGYTSDMIESYKTGVILQRHHLGNPSVGFNEITRMLFENNRHIAQRIFNEPLGQLKIGASADVIVADYRPYTPLNEANLDGHIQFGMNGSLVYTVIVDGKVVMKDNEIKTLDEKEVLKGAKEASQKLWSSLGAM